MQIVEDQLAGAAVAAANIARPVAEAAAQVAQQTAFETAMAEMQVVREFIGAPNEILGSALTKHGEIAEVVEVGVRRAHDWIDQRPMSAFDASSRTAPEVYFIGGDAVQSKFINGTPKSLDHVQWHMEKYEYFGRDGSSHYHIPKDQYEDILKVRAGDTAELSAKSVRAIEEKIRAIEEASGKPFEDVVKPSTSTYGEVQQGKVYETLDRHNDELIDKNEQRKEQIQTDHEPSLADGLKTAAGAAAIAGALGFVTSMGNKYFVEKKNFLQGDFTQEDWAEVGLGTATAAGTGAVTAGAVYMLTNYAGTSAPLATAFVSATKGVASLVKQYNAGSISEAALADDSLLLCTDIAVVTLFSAAGQALIPVPVLGALIGSFAGKAACEILGSMATEEVIAVQKRLREARGKLAAEHHKVLAQMEEMFLPTEALTQFAFDIRRNQKLLEASIVLARIHGVPETKLLKSAGDALKFLQEA